LHSKLSKRGFPFEALTGVNMPSSAIPDEGAWCRVPTFPENVPLA
jgi:hypothetical protein